MHNPFIFGENNKRYHTWSRYLRKTFGCKVGKAALDGGFTCPNRDGNKGVGGCIYCSGRGSGDFAPDSFLDIPTQYAQQRTMLLRKWPDSQCIAYFQAYSNTYAPVEELRLKYEAALAQPGVVGICIATRADLLEDDVVDYLQELSTRTWLMVELGLQTVHDSTALLLNRCHSYIDFLDGYRRLTESGIRICVHIINGLPYETDDMMLETIRQVGKLRPHSIKLHMLYILSGSAIADAYYNGDFSLLEPHAYIDLICRQLELLPPEIVVQRLTGDPPSHLLIAPSWATNKRTLLNGIDKELSRRDTWQGKLIVDPA